MPLIEWNDDLSIGIPTVDADHQKLFGLVNYLYDSMLAGKGHKVIDEFLGALIIYVKQHFDLEESFFSSSKFPHVAEHRAEHDDLLKQLVDLQEKCKSGTASVQMLEMIGFLNKWLVDHIRVSDKKYASHIHSKGCE